MRKEYIRRVKNDPSLMEVAEQYLPPEARDSNESPMNGMLGNAADIAADIGDDGSEESEVNTLSVGAARVISLSKVSAADTEKLSTNIPRLDRVMDGGFVEGTSIVIGGGPGAGKTTLCMQIAEALGAVTYFASGEMQARRIKVAAKRLKVNVNRVNVLETTDINEACSIDPDALLRGKNAGRTLVAIFDAIQVFTSQDVSGAAGSNTQTVNVMAEITKWTRKHDVISFAISRLNSDGEIHGPNATQHDGDVTMMIRCPDGSKSSRRLIEVLKNRDGLTGDTECSMGAEGLVF